MYNFLFFLFYKLLLIKFSKKKKNIQNYYRDVLGNRGCLTILLQESRSFSNVERSIIINYLNFLCVFFLDYFRNIGSITTMTCINVPIICFPLTYDYRSKFECGHLHPISKGVEKILTFFKTIGFFFVAGKEIEIRLYNFDALNIGKNHPAQSSSDTFYFEKSRLLRTHTSSIQIREMIKLKPPMSLFTIGKVYRKDYDVSHTPMFFQMECLLIQKNVSLGSLFHILIEFLNFFFEQQNTIIRIRPSYFPFTEPSVEIDIACFFCTSSNNYDRKRCVCCSGSGWVEVLGAGMVHERVFRKCNVSSMYNGFAFGIGVDRLVALYYKITDLRLNFTNELRYLEQF